MYDFRFLTLEMAQPFVEFAPRLGLRVKVCKDPAVEEVTLVRLYQKLDDAVCKQCEMVYEWK